MTTFFFGSVGEQIISNEDSGNGNADVQIQLYNNGILTSAFGFLDGARIVADVTQIPSGSGTNDVIVLNQVFNNTGIGPDWRACILWDEQTQTNFGVAGQHNVSWENLYGGNRYGLPSANTTVAYETIIGSNGDDIVKLDYNAVNGGVAYTFDITLNLGEGRDLGIGGEGNDAIFGGNETSDLGDGLWGMGGNDTLYGGYNNAGLGADDLYGYAGNDTIFGHNNGDVYYGDQGNDTIFAAGWQGSIAFGGNASEIGNSVTMWGGDGDDTFFASTAIGAVQVYYGGQPSPYWVDARFTAGANNTDTGVNDIVNYFGAAAGVALDLDVGTVVENWPGALSGFPNMGSFTLTVGSGSGGAANGDTFYGIEHVIGSDTGNDIITGSSVANRLEGGGGNDSLAGEAGNDTLFGGTGADTINGGTGGDTLNGGTVGEGNWLMYNTSGAVSVDIGANIASGNEAAGDVISNFDNLVGGAGADALTGSSSANTIYGGAGNDTIHGGGAGDSLAGGGDAGDFISYAGSPAGVTLNLATNAVSGGDGTGDSISGFLNAIGSASADSITGTAGVNTIFGGSGNDSIEGGAGADSLHGSTGTGDWVVYTNSAAGVSIDLSLLTAQGGAGDGTGDVLAEFENLIGSAQNDALTGSSAANTIYGGAGNDTVHGGGSGDSMDGGAGTNDFLSYAASGSGVNVTLSAGTASGGDGTGDSFVNFESAIGSGFNDGLSGDGNANTLFGGAGVDTIDGGLGNDSLVGGGNGDYVHYLNSASSVVVNLTSNTATGGLGSDALSGFQHVFGSNSNDTLTGDGLANSLVGASGADSLLGAGGGDFLFGDAGNDSLDGQAGFDTLFGGDDTDRFIMNTEGGLAGGSAQGGWDGETGSGAIIVTGLGGAVVYGDTVYGGEGGTDADIMDLSVVSNANARSVYQFGNWNTASPVGMAGIEIIIAGSAADVINLSFNDGVTRNAYAENVTVEGAGGADVVFSGSGNDLIVGGLRSGASTNTADTLYGGAGNDTIFGDDQASAATGGADFLFGSAGNDTVFSGLGNDTAFGGSGSGDSVFGEAGNDVLSDLLDGGNLFGGAGLDTLTLSGNSSLNYTISGGANDGTDGADLVMTSGAYGLVTGSLGEGNDRFFSSSSDAGSAQVDRINAENGDDVVSTWWGNDTIDGGSGNDALWGGAGADTIYGGAGTDYLYGGAGNGDVMVGGAGIDFYYWSRTDGVDMIIENDPNPIPVTGAKINAIVVIPDFDFTETTAGSDGMRTGSGVFEVDQDIYDNVGGNDMVQLVDIDGAGGTMYRLDILTGLGAGSSMTFDQTDISNIILWNNDATAGTPVITQYVWDAVDQRYEYMV